MSSLKPEQIAELKDAFSLFDRNGDGKLTVAELREIFKAIGVVVPHEPEVESLLKQAESQNQGSLDFSAFLQIMTKALKDDSNLGTEEDLKEAFRVFDKTNNGHINSAELKKILCGSKALSEAEFDEIMKDAAVDEEGDFEYEPLGKKLIK